MILEIIENLLQTKNLSVKEKYYWFRGLFSKKYSCGNKIKYGIKSALKAKEAMEKKHNKKFDVYKCIWCGKYHIGGSISKYIDTRKSL